MIVKQVACALIGVRAEVCVFEAGGVVDELPLVSPPQLAKNTVQASSNAMRNMGCSLKSGAFFNFSPPLLNRNSARSIFGTSPVPSFSGL